MLSIFDLCTPREEVLKGELSEDIFAARLKDVIENTADPVYRNAKTFFENTYPTSGLTTLIDDALGRLVGSAAGKNAIIRLETGFGGGKTHNLIALYHICMGGVSQPVIQQFTGQNHPALAPGSIKVAGVVGSDLDPTIGIHHPEYNLTTFTLWGELAVQLGGKEGYELVKQSEYTKAAPGTVLLERLVGDQPTLVLIDEIARHLRASLATPTATGQSTLADQTIAFLMSLLEYAASRERFLVVLTLAGGSDAFAPETELLRQKLAETLQISARQERVLTPTAEGEIYSIVTHRLFKAVDRARLAEPLAAYRDYYRQMSERNADLPIRCSRAEYQEEMRNAYPFHPELLTTLNRKTATIPNFNQTRGALRLLAWTVRNLWHKKPANTWMIHPYHIDLSEYQIAQDLTTHLDRPKFRQVIESDIASHLKGSSAHAQDIDEHLLAAGKPPYANRLATSIFLHSLTQGVASGVDPSDLNLAVLTPGFQSVGDKPAGGDDPAVVAKSLEKLVDSAWFLEYDGRRYRFKTEPSINKIIADEVSQISNSKGKAEIDRRIPLIWLKGFLKPVLFPVEAADVDDDVDLPKLAIMHYEACSLTARETAPPDLVRKIYAYSGAMESFRKYQNNLLFLVADKDQVEHMIQVSRRYLAICQIVDAPDRMGEFTKEQRERLRKEREAAELDIRVAITKSYRHLFYPSADAPKSNANLAMETLPAQDQGEVEKDQTQVILRILRMLKKILSADEEALSAVYLKSKAWDLNQKSMTSDELRKAFARKPGLRILLDIGQLKKTIKNGVDQKIWLYYDSNEGLAYDQDSPPPAYQVSDQAILYMPEEAQRLKLPIKGKVPAGGGDVLFQLCPVCGRPENQCICGLDEGGGGIQLPAKLHGEGAANQAFEQILDQCQEHGLTHLNRLVIRIDNVNKQIASDLRALGLAIPQFGKAAFAVDLELLAGYGAPEKRESFSQAFRGSWERYKRLKAVVESFAAEADELTARLAVSASFEHGLEVNGEQYSAMREILTTLQIGKIKLEAFPQLPEEGASS